MTKTSVVEKQQQKRKEKKRKQQKKSSTLYDRHWIFFLFSVRIGLFSINNISKEGLIKQTLTIEPQWKYVTGVLQSPDMLNTFDTSAHLNIFWLVIL